MIRYAVRSLSAILTAFYLLVSTGSCAVRKPEEIYSPVTDIPVESPGEIAVNILQSIPEISLPLQQAAELYGPEGVAFHIQTIPGREDYRAALRSKLLAGEDIDLFHLLGVDDVDRLRDELEDLTSLPWAASAAGGTLDAVSLDNKLYGIPYSLEGVGLVVNRAVFETAGISLEGITDFGSLSQAFTELQTQIDAGELAESFPKLEAVADLALQDTDYLADQAAELMLYGAYASPLQAYYSPSLDLPAAEGAESLLKLLAEVSPQQGAWKDFASVTQLRVVEGGLAAGRIAASLQSTQIYRQVYAANPDLEGRLALLPLYFPDSEQGAVFAGAPVWWAVNKNSTEDAKKAAAGLLTWLYRSEEGTDFYARELDALSPYRDTAADTGNLLHRQLLSAVEEGFAAPRLAPDAPGNWGETVFAAGLREYFTVYEKKWTGLVQDCKKGWGERQMEVSR